MKTPQKKENTVIISWTIEKIPALFLLLLQKKGDVYYYWLSVLFQNWFS